MATKTTILDMQKLAETKGGKCLDEVYINTGTWMDWECHKGHKFRKRPQDIKTGSWCAECKKEEPGNNVKQTIEDMFELAKKQNGKCISTVYTNSVTELDWECEKGHRFKRTPRYVTRGGWCPHCLDEKHDKENKKKLKMAQDVAKERNGECLSTAYSSDKPMKWKCNNHHVFEDLFHNVNRRISWCHICAEDESGQNKLNQKKKWAKAKGGSCLSGKYEEKGHLHWECSEGHHWSTEVQDENLEKKWCPTCSELKVEAAIALAKKKNGKCLSTEYLARTKIEWECSEGHIWQEKFSAVRSGAWCKECDVNPGASIPYTIKEMQEYASSKGGTCLSEDFLPKKRVKWECEKGHVFTTAATIARKKTWCRKCSSIRLTLEDMISYAESQSGKCLSTTYVDSSTKLTWECEKGHQWEASPNIRNQKQWCPACANHVPLTIQDMKEYAESRGGKCLSDEINPKKKLLWECEKGHQWRAHSSIKRNNYWCAKCNGTARLSIEDMQMLAREFGGKCISTEYKTNSKKLKWECANHHVFELVPKHVQRGIWCTKCGGNHNEEKVRFIFETLFNEPFNKTRTVLSGLKELDGFNEKLKVAFEYQGEQHYHYIEHFHGDEEGFQKRLQDDFDKVEECNSLGIHLIQVPYWLSNDEEKVQYIKDELLKINIKIHNQHVNFQEYYIKDLKMIEMAKRIHKQGAELLSTSHKGTGIIYHTKCKKGHITERYGHDIKKGKRCGECAPNKKKTIEDVHNLLADSDLACLTTKYVRNNVPLQLQCSKGHDFERSYDSLRTSKECPKCSGKSKKSIEDMQTLAFVNEGACVSKVYVNAHTKLLWKCKHGNTFEMKPNTVQQGKWCTCPKCKKRRIHNEKQLIHNDK